MFVLFDLTFLLFLNQRQRRVVIGTTWRTPRNLRESTKQRKMNSFKYIPRSIRRYGVCIWRTGPDRRENRKKTTWKTHINDQTAAIRRSVHCTLVRLASRVSHLGVSQCVVSFFKIKQHYLTTSPYEKLKRANTSFIARTKTSRVVIIIVTHTHKRRTPIHFLVI